MPVQVSQSLSSPCCLQEASGERPLSALKCKMEVASEVLLFVSEDLSAPWPGVAGVLLSGHGSKGT